MEMNYAFSSSLTKTTPTHNNRSRTIETPYLTSNGYIWIKYRNKTISNTKYPKKYYRCAFKKAKKCEAIKHVQIISKKPPKFVITYFAQHTCQPLLNNNNSPSINILDSNEEDCTNFTISFESKIPTSINTQNLNPVACNPLPSPNINDRLPSSLPTIHPPPVAHTSTPTTIESLLADDDFACFKNPEQLYSPTIIPILSPDYYMSNSILETVEDYSLMMVANNSFDTTDAFLPDLQLWE